MLSCLPQRIKEKIMPEPMSGCWLWTGKIDKYGYGHTRQGYSCLLAHRFVYMLANNKIVKPEILICHKCDVRSCVNPTHLFEGTYQDNNQDTIIKGKRPNWKTKIYTLGY